MFKWFVLGGSIGIFLTLFTKKILESKSYFYFHDVDYKLFSTLIYGSMILILISQLFWWINTFEFWNTIFAIGFTFTVHLLYFIFTDSQGLLGHFKAITISYQISVFYLLMFFLTGTILFFTNFFNVI